MKNIELDLDDETIEKVKTYMKIKNLNSFDEALNILVIKGLKQEEKLEKMN